MARCPLVPSGCPSKKIGHRAQPGSARLRNIGHRACSGTCFSGGHRAAQCPVPALHREKSAKNIPNIPKSRFSVFDNCFLKKKIFTYSMQFCMSIFQRRYFLLWLRIKAALNGCFPPLEMYIYWNLQYASWFQSIAFAKYPRNCKGIAPLRS